MAWHCIDCGKIWADNVCASLTGFVCSYCGARRGSEWLRLTVQTKQINFSSIKSQSSIQQAQSINNINYIKAALREEITMLRDILTDWLEGSPEEITYRLPVRQSDGSWKLIHYTQTMTKTQVENLIDNLEIMLRDIG